MTAQSKRLDVGAIFTAELAAVIEHEIEIARLERECARIMAERRAESGDEGDGASD